MINIIQLIINQIPQPPAQFPVWLIPILGFILPFIYEKILSPLGSWLKFALVGLITYGVAVIAVLAAGIPLNGSLSLFVYIFTFAQFIYQLMIKPVIKAINKNKPL